MAYHRRSWREVWVGLGLVLSVAGCGGGGEPDARASASPPPSAPVATLSEASAAPVNTAPPSVATQAFTAELLTAINEARATARLCGTTSYPAVGSLSWNNKAESAALTQAQFLQSTNQFTHTGANGSNVGDRLSATGYAWLTVGENLAAGFDTVPKVVAAWLESPGHCANLMNAQFTDMGVALVAGNTTNTFQSYWGMVLARPR